MEWETPSVLNWGYIDSWEKIGTHMPTRGLHKMYSVSERDLAFVVTFVTVLDEIQ